MSSIVELTDSLSKPSLVGEGIRKPLDQPDCGALPDSKTSATAGGGGYCDNPCDSNKDRKPAALMTPSNSSSDQQQQLYVPERSAAPQYEREVSCCSLRIAWNQRRMALDWSLWFNVAITISKLVIYVKTLSLSVLAAFLDSVLDVVSQLVLSYTESHSSLQRSSAVYPAGASRLEPIGVLTCAALMGMASFEVLKQSIFALLSKEVHVFTRSDIWGVFYMLGIVAIKLFLLWLCHLGANRRRAYGGATLVKSTSGNILYDEDNDDVHSAVETASMTTKTATTVIADPTLQALAQDHLNDALSNSVAAGALGLALYSNKLWFVDPVGAILISLYIIYSWFSTGKEQIEHLIGKSAPTEFIEELRELADSFDERMKVDIVRAYHFGPKFLVEIEVVMDASTLLFESHDLGMDLQYEIEGREEVERCFVHIDYQERPYDEHVVSKVPTLREKYLQPKSNYARSTQSV
jgi:cation diffusion facilitator family transporter